MEQDPADDSKNSNDDSKNSKKEDMNSDNTAGISAVSKSDGIPEDAFEDKKKHKVRLLISYDGTHFCGWQRQLYYNLPSVQMMIEKGLSKIFNEKISIVGASRTDAGVHAVGQTAHFYTSKIYKKVDLSWALQSQLPKTIVIKDFWLAPPEFHATVSAVKKTYKYYIHNDRRPTALGHRYSNWVRHEIDLDFLNEAAQLLVGTKDFRSFQTSGNDMKSTTRTIFKARWERKSSKSIVFSITGSGFLKQMVRNIVGTLLEMDYRQFKVDELQKILDARDRCRALTTAPPQGLFLYKVYYPKELDNKCLRF